jgi:hypothetical protein
MLSVESKFAAVCEALKSKGDFATFTERSKTLTGASIEAKLNCALAVLKETAKIVEGTTAEGKWDLVYQASKPITESDKPIKKNNGAEDTFVEGDPFAGQRSTSFSYELNEADSDPYAKGDRLICEALKLTPEQTRKVLKLDDAMPADLNEGQRQEWRFARSIGISESDCTKLVRITGGYGSGYSKGAYGSGRAL